MFLLIDNYDSFTYNLLHYLGELGAEVEVRRNDALSAGEALALKPQGIVISPGPCDPNKAGICLDVLAQAPDDLPIFGVCLGHQCIGQHFGGTVDRAPAPMHGKTDDIRHSGDGIFAGIPSPLTATRYHSLTVLPDNIPDCLEVTATSPDGVVQGLSHKTRPIHGVQFHPESIASEHGHALLRNFINLSNERIAA
ncbi:MAG: aminodeoxychorismate/anthranilate synthase component II [Rhodospirillaceae bacterium]|jgi:anthranilate synthase component II|nr:aminodeoxychorismate/anthranilate synthase component II [Rhodospirillaceae bacterium]MBT4219427.1 aminodeoxychorismate/anthranilate synthase component II [Rhodospirillaceae bacterium]MBT4463536.1 aminodeoxychorismate/anthranilate synthase component II [Rhodospirillaceae bacterium]MBT5013409.1 aminodeoxychorismate/anthranilate synthase component II [Rhodospirillaceae bacterium]MBT5308120.1 aminodeoxychorismate/anthranilate synthase component II [Rhodospirillaceae bacterium]